MDYDELIAQVPFAASIGVRIVSAERDHVVGELDWQPGRTTSVGTMHGGALMTLGDTIGALCAWLNLPEGAGTSTVSSATVFLRGVRSGTVTATARPLHVGRSTIAVETELRDQQGRLVAQVTQTQAVLAG